MRNDRLFARERLDQRRELDVAELLRERARSEDVMRTRRADASTTTRQIVRDTGAMIAADAISAQRVPALHDRTHSVVTIYDAMTSCQRTF